MIGWDRNEKIDQLSFLASPSLPKHTSFDHFFPNSFFKHADHINKVYSHPPVTGTMQGVGQGGLSPPHTHTFADLSLTTQTRSSNLTILNTHKQRTDKLCLVDVANEFAALNDNRKGNFGTFRESDSKMSW